MDSQKGVLDANQQVQMVLAIANILRGPFKEDEYQNVIIPMTILRRFECILDKTKDDVVKAFESGETNEKVLRHKSHLSIYNTSRFTLSRILEDPGKTNENLKDYLDHFDSISKTIFSQMKFYDTIDQMDKGRKLYVVIKKFANIDLSETKVSAMQMGTIMEEIIRTYSENASAGDHFTPREVIKCLTQLLLAQGCDDLFEDGKIVTLGDFACGTGGMLSEGFRQIKSLNNSTDVELFGQDNNGWYEGIAEAEMIIRGQDPENVKLVSSTLTTDAFSNSSMRLILMNPPFGLSWAKKEIGDEDYSFICNQNKKDGFYPGGLPTTGDSQMLFWQFAMHKLDPVKGRAAIICNGSPLFTGGASSGESDIRKWLFDNDWIDTIIQFCPELFYNTGISIYALILDKNKPVERKNKVLLIDASSLFHRMPRGLGFKRNELNDEHIDKIVHLYCDYKENDLCKIYDKSEFFYREVPVNAPYQRSFQISSSGIDEFKTSKAYLNLCDPFRIEELQELDTLTVSQKELLDRLLDGKKIQDGLIASLNKSISEERWFDRKAFTKHLASLIPGISSNKLMIKALVSSFSTPDPAGNIYPGDGGHPESDPDLKDVETVPFNEKIEDYFKKEVQPFLPNSWMETDPSSIRIGTEINFAKYFFKPDVSESPESILQHLKDLELQEKVLLEKITHGTD